jgi:amino acid adenylation domain-containing protein
VSRSAALTSVLDAGLSGSLEARGPLDTVLLSLWRLLLVRLGRIDGPLLVGLGGRTGIHGYGSGRVSLRVEIEGDPSFAELVADTGRRIDAAREESASADESRWTFDFAVPAFRRMGRPQLGLSCSPRARGVALELGFDTTHFDADEVRRILARLEALARSAAVEPDLPVTQLGLLPEEERRRVLTEFNDTAEAAAPSVCIHELIQESSRRDPDAPAVLADGRELSYGELERRAASLAARLRAFGIGPNTFVAVHAEPSPGMIVGLLAVLKAGGAYVPLDPEYPDDRLAFMLEDSGAPVLLTQDHLRPIRAPGQVRTVVLDADGRPDTPAAPGEVTARRGSPDDLAYLIYTSGSTGVPKGVRVDHRNLVHSTLARCSYYRGKVGRFLLLSSFAFDSSVAGLFWTLVDGGALVLPPAGAHRDPGRIGELMERFRVTHTLCLASHWRLILSGAKPEAFAALDTSIVSGEVFSSELVERHDERAPGTRLFNEYGPTEGSVWSMVFDCHDPYPGNKVPIGRPIANTQIYLLDQHGSPVPIGVPGEMYQGGAGVARGYLNRPELTAERFVPDPFSERDDARLYRSGDLALYLPDGDVEFLGRIDDQVKIRGYRIELGEIEAVLGRHPAVREVAVLCREDTEGDRRLVAYVVLEDGRSASAGELRDSLAETLPAYMLPAATAFLDVLPRTSIGKLAPEALPAPPRERPDVGGDYVAPRTPVEEAVASIWAEAIDLECVGVDDDFFALGGHSVLAVRIMSSIRELLDVELPMRAFFEHPTVSRLAAELTRDPARRERVERRTEIFERVSALPDDEVEEQLARRSTR